VQAFVQAVDTLMVHLERDLKLQVGYFIGDHHLEDATAMFLYCAQVDTWDKEAVEPSDQRVGMEQAVDKANGVTHANGAVGVRCKYGTADLWCKYDAEGLCPLLARNGGTDGTCTQLRRPIDSRQVLMDPLLLCGTPRLSLCGAPMVSPCGEPQPIGADVPSLLCGAPSIMLCGRLQPLGTNMPILIRGPEAPCAKGLLNLGDDAHHSVVHRVAGERLLVFPVNEVDGRGGALVGWHAWGRWMCYRLFFLPPCVAGRLGLCAISLGGGKQVRKWREIVACS